MTDPFDSSAPSEVVLGAREALNGPSPAPDAQVLAAVQDGLLRVPAGSPSGWFDVPGQRSRVARGTLSARRHA